MIVITRLPLAPPSRPNRDEKLFLALGNFDGLHRGHRAMLKALKKAARAVEGRVAILTFQKHPRVVLKKGLRPSLISSLSEKFSLLAEAGVDRCYWIPFTRAFARQSPEQFVRRVLVKKLSVDLVCMGRSARFGKKRAGNVQTMAALGKKYGFRFRAVGYEKYAGAAITSSRIRVAIQKGKLDDVQAMLGHTLRLTGVVVRGKRRGREQGLPTANLDTEGALLPPNGVYAVRAEIVRFQKKTSGRHCFDFSETIPKRGLKGVMNIGFRPTFKEKHACRPVPEVYLLNYTGKLYGKYLRVHLVKYLRPERAFPSPGLLAAQIRKDVVSARKYLK